MVNRTKELSSHGPTEAHRDPRRRYGPPPRSASSTRRPRAGKSSSRDGRRPMSPTPFLEAFSTCRAFIGSTRSSMPRHRERSRSCSNATPARCKRSPTDGRPPNPVTHAPFSPYEGCRGLNSEVALQLDGVLFMEGEGRPAELSHLIRDLRSAARDFQATGEWLATAMQASWDIAAGVDGHRGARRPLGRAAPDHRQRLAGRGHELADRAPARPRCGHPRERRLHPGSASSRPCGAAGHRPAACTRPRS